MTIGETIYLSNPAGNLDGVAFGGSMDTDWMMRGKCKELDPGIFFPNDWVGVQVAQRICADCPVKSLCLEYALQNRVDHGVWGGASERERRRILRQRRLAKTRGARS
ncbi:MAG: WhiB family transcriptional regulator [Acidimicrobiales bacterium]|jgi:WhiB family transcriptional regulator, redox-sensing transcriptional regulator